MKATTVWAVDDIEKRERTAVHHDGHDELYNERMG